MSESLDDKILQAYNDIKQKEKISKHLIHLNISIQKLKERIDWLDGDLRKAGTKLDRWQKIADSSVYQFLHFLLQNREEVEDLIERENHQYYLKILELNDLKQQLELLLFEKKVLEEKNDKLQHIDYQLKKLLKEKEKNYTEDLKNDQYKKDLAEEQQNIFFQRALIEEMEDALQLGNLCKKTLNEIISDIKKVYDVDKLNMYGIDQYSKEEKKKFIEKLTAACNFVGRHLQQFNIELKDISVSLQIDYQKDFRHFELFTKRFYGIFYSSSSANDSLGKLSKHLNHLRNEVIKWVDKLMADIERAERSIKRSERKKELIILLDIKRTERKDEPK